VPSPLSLLRPMAILLMVAPALTACSSDASPPSDGASVTPHVFPPPVGAGQIPLIDRHTDRLVVFDVDRAAVVSAAGDDQTFQYSLPGRRPSTIITSGDSDENRSELVEMTDDGVRVLRSLDRAAYPIARTGDTTYLQLSTIRPDGSLGATSLARVTPDGDVDPIADLDAQIAGAVVVDGRLWYTTHDADSDLFALWSASLTEAFEPRPERRGLRTGALFRAGEKVVVDGDFGSRLPRVDCSLHCLVDDRERHVFSLTTGETALTLTAFNLGTGASKILAEGEIVDFFTDGPALMVYQAGAVTTIGHRDLP